MIPLRARARTRRFPWVTLSLVVANAIVFAWMLRLSTSWLALSGPAAASFVDRFAFVPARLTAAPASPTVWLTVFTAMSMHAGWLHIAFNMLYLWIFGTALEDRLGRPGFLALYLGCGVVAALAQWAIAPASPVPVIGASGAIAGLLGAYLVLLPRNEVTVVIPLFVFFEVATLPAWIPIVVFFVLQLAQAVVTLGDPAAGGVAFFAHVGGFVTGVVVAMPIAAASAMRRRFDGGGGR